MGKILGLDLGTNSIGWAIRDLSEIEDQIIDKGVLTFDKGVGEEKGIEVPLVKKRTESRSKRRNYQAKKYRKWEILKCFIENNPKMCPLTMDELNGWRKYKKGEVRAYPKSEDFIHWLKLDFNSDGEVDFTNPYELRKVAAERKIDNPLIIGRVFYHLVQRRGFRGRDEVESKTIIEGSEKNNTLGAKSIHKIMEEQNTTLGGALYYEMKNNGKRIRKRYNLRTDFEAELKTICSVQGIDENSELYKRLYKAIIWQRPLRTQKGNIGRCTLEKNKPRCPISHPIYEEYRAWCFINNIKIRNKENSENKFEPLTLEQRRTIYTKLFFRKNKPQFEFVDIIKLIDPRRNTFEFKYNEQTSISGCPISTSIKEIFNTELCNIKIFHTVNDKRNKEKDYYDFEDIWHILFSFDSKEKLYEFAKTSLKLDEESAGKFCKIRLPQGYASLSLSAIKKILPLLHMGFIYSNAVYLANIEKVLGKKLPEEILINIAKDIELQILQYKEEKEIIGIANNLINRHLNLPINERNGRFSEYVLLQKDYNDIENQLIESFGSKTWDEITGERKDLFRLGVKKLYQTYLQASVYIEKGLLFYKIPRLDERIKLYFEKGWNVSKDNLKYLYHPSQIEMYKPAKEIDGKKYLNDPMPISRGFKNPMAMKTLHNLKRLINYLIEQEKIDEDTRIVIEIARELNDANRRKAIEKWQREREQQNKEYYNSIKELAEKYGLNVDINKDDIIDKYRLWIEQNRQCLYTGKTINCSELFDGSKFDFEHTIPASLSFDNELKNLTITDSKYNREIKQKRIPTELPNYEYNATIENESYTAIKPRLKFMEEKVAHFESQIEFWKKESKKALTKERKDYCIQQRHYNNFEKEYWGKKLDTFTIKEYKAGWRNSQLHDTQIITKYALPYLKTVFNKVEVQKGTITAEFRKIFNVGFKKNRDRHIHHAIDAAILTLIPTAIQRDKLLKEHFIAMENQLSFHSFPNAWMNFNPEYVRHIEENTLANHITQNKTLLKTKKYVRKRGKIQYLKSVLPNGKFQYKLNLEGKKIPLVAQGDSIRGQLHEESFLGAIKEFDQNENDKYILNNGNISFKKDKYGNDKLTFVKRILLKDFNSINDLKNIVDKKVCSALNNTINQRMSLGKSFKEAIAEDIWMTDKQGNPKKSDKKGNPISPIRHVRCKVAAGMGYLTKGKALEIKEHTMLSKYEHKETIYAKNEEMTLCLYYEGSVNNKFERVFKFIGLFELAQYKLKRFADISLIQEFQFCTAGRGHNKTLLPLNCIITSGTRVLIYKESPDEIRELNKNEILKRLYQVFKFNEAQSPYIYLQHHAEARQDKELGVGQTLINLDKYQPRLKLVANNFNCLIEGKDFNITIDGKIILK